MKIGRNDPCPCGSGKKFKRCHMEVARSVGASQSVPEIPPLLPPDRVYAASLDTENKRILFTSNDVLFNQLRDCSQIAEAFDGMCAKDLEVINQEVCHCTATLISALATRPQAPPNSDLLVTCYALLANALQTFVGAVELTRRGFRLQSGVLLRNVVESVSTACHVALNEHDLEKLREGKLSASRTIATAKKIVPTFGKMYGLFSNSFVHISDFHYSVDSGSAVKKWEEGEEALEFILRALRFMIWSMNVAAELCFFDSLLAHRFFQKVESGFLFSPTPAERQRMEELFV